MKLRIQDNSLRLRLNQKEVARLGEQGLVESAIQFSADRVLRYSVSVSRDLEKPAVQYEANSICVFLPEAVAKLWINSHEIAIESVHSGVQLLVEKDFRCLHQEGAADPEAYPHPLE